MSALSDHETVQRDYAGEFTRPILTRIDPKMLKKPVVMTAAAEQVVKEIGRAMAQVSFVQGEDMQRFVRHLWRIQGCRTMLQAGIAESPTLPASTDVFC